MKITRTYLKAKNGLLLNIGVMAALIMVTGVWYVGVNSRVHGEIADLQDIVEITDNIYEEGLVAINNADVEDLGAQKLKAKKLQQLQKLFPEARQYVFSEDPTESLALQDTTLKLVEKPKNEKKPYVQWLRDSFTPEMNDGLVESQKEFGEILPVFVALAPDEQETEQIYGKIDLKNIVQLVEDDFFAAHEIPNVEGALGIRNVFFDDVIPDLGYYEISARVESIPSNNIMDLIKFVGTLGSIRTEVLGENGVPSIIHLSSIPSRVQDRKDYMAQGRSALSNPLVTISSLIVEPGGDRLSDVTSNDADPYLTLSPRSRFREWNMIITLRFYVRGAAPEHIDVIESQIKQLLAGSKQRPASAYNTYLPDEADWGLADRLDNALLTSCTQCSELTSVRQLRSDLETITEVFNKLQEEYSLEDKIKPTTRIQEMMDILAVLNNIKTKFEDLNTKLN